MRTLRTIISMVLTGILVAGAPARTVMAITLNEVNPSYEEIELLKGDIEKIETRNMKRVSITDPMIADINNAKANGVELVALAAGQTVLFIWDDTGKRTILVRVNDEDLGLIKNRVETLFATADLKGIIVSQNAAEGKLILTGRVREDKMTAMSNIIAPFGEKILNLVEKESVEDLIQIDMQVTELSSTLDKEFGVKWQGSPFQYEEATPATLIPRQSGSFQDLFKIGKFSRTNELMAQVNALITKGKAKVLSKPRLVVISGKEATVLVGGEIPIKTTTGTGDSSQENITYKEYGLSMAITPTIQENGMVSVLLNFENSSLDDSVPTASGETAMTTTSTQTQLMLENHQTIVLAGMIKSQKSETVTRVPFLSAIPLVGTLFRHTSRPDTQKEIVISITATVLRSGKVKTQVKNAGESKGSGNSFNNTLPGAVERYAVSVQEKIGSAIAYPVEAQEKEWQGTVKLALVLDQEGALKSAAVKESSGYAVFDEDALNTAQALSPYDTFPEEITQDEIMLTIPIVYSLDAFLKNVGNRS